MTQPKPSHPGQIYKRLLERYGVDIEDPSLNHIKPFLNGERDCDIVHAIDIARATNTSPAHWWNLQLNYNQWQEENEPEVIIERFIKVAQELIFTLEPNGTENHFRLISGDEILIPNATLQEIHFFIEGFTLGRFEE